MGLLARVFMVPAGQPTPREAATSIAIIAALYWAVFWASGPLLKPLLRSMRRKDQLSAMVRIPSLLNCLFVVPLAWHLLATVPQSLPEERIFSRSLGGNTVTALAAGFFVFDLSHVLFDFQVFYYSSLFCFFCMFSFSVSIRTF